MAFVAAGVTVALIIMVIARLVWVESSESSHTYSRWRGRHALDASIVVVAALFVAATLYRFVTMG